MNWNAVWIQPEYDMGDIVPVYTKQFSLSKIPVLSLIHILPWKDRHRDHRVKKFSSKKKAESLPLCFFLLIFFLV